MSQQVIEIHGAKREFADAEFRIEKATRRAFYDLGTELRGIREKRWYRDVAGFDTFEEYCNVRWDWTPQRVGQLIAAASALDEIETKVSILPTRETHVRPLLSLSGTADQVEVWGRVVDVSQQTGERITARLVKQEADRKLAELSRNWITVDEWPDADDVDRDRALQIRQTSKVFNRQDNDSIEWARWSWNPITGCRHACAYCYAQDIAARFFPQGFEPSIIPERLGIPQASKPPRDAEIDVGWRNVFTCSMADLFGEWVPEEWIHAVFSAIETAPDFNFLMLTKNPQRLRSFNFPANAWIGATVDRQSRVRETEDAFADVVAPVKFLSCEPLSEPLTFERLDLFDWVIIGGASKSTRTAESRPDRAWVNALEADARNAGCKVYEKPNLLDRIREYPGGDR